MYIAFSLKLLILTFHILYIYIEYIVYCSESLLKRKDVSEIQADMHSGEQMKWTPGKCKQSR